ncbi:MAG: BtpA/SgcQ family protein [Phycisphaeraceae bacterium]|nr:BtpA/SgcQ family protein [Phycisphaeraceae bacterium]MCW5763457.1 BtpA/SgcQ family protein [Phycisphaeraceae bacterium]
MNNWPFERKAVIGMVHVGALPGTPKSRMSVSALAADAAREAAAIESAGLDAVMIENMHDCPYVHGEALGPEITSAMTKIGQAVRDAISLPLGVQILSGGNRHALAVALAIDAQFIRCENFVFSHIADEGLLAEAEAGPLLRYRRNIGADHIAIYCDIKKKHASHAITADLDLAQCVNAAEFFGADGIIVTGSATGLPTSIDDVSAARSATTLPILVGSGTTPNNVLDMLAHADAVIVGSSIKHEGIWSNPVDPRRCEQLVRSARTPRGG